MKAMPRLLRRLLAFLLLLLPAAAAVGLLPFQSAPARVAGGLPDARFSIDAAAIVTQDEAVALQQSGAQIVRLILSWAQVEPNAPAGSTHVYDWAEPDTMLGILAA